MSAPKPHRKSDQYTVVNADSLEYLKTLPDNSVDSIVTDPPYEIGFMGRGWDNTGIAYNVELWKECLRVLKPGGHALVFGATRTYHRVAVAIEDAGFEIRDSIHWVYGSGFPKSMDISKAIDKVNGEVGRLHKFTEYMRSTGLTAKQLNAATGTSMGSHYLTDKSQPAIPTPELWAKVRPLIADVPAWVDELVDRIEAEREVIGKYESDMGGLGGERIGESGGDITAPATPEAQQWSGWGTALKPAHEPIVVARKPVEGTVAQNVLTYGVGGLNIDASRVGLESSVNLDARQVSGARSSDGLQFGGIGANGTDIPMYNPSGRFPANILLTHNADCELISEGSTTTTTTTAQLPDMRGGNFNSGTDKKVERDINSYADQPAVYQCSPGCPVAAMDEQSGTLKSGELRAGVVMGKSKGNSFGVANGTTYEPRAADAGGASRFFTNLDHDAALTEVPFYYSGKAPKKERPVHPETGKGHPTVKPLELMRWLIRLVTPAGGTVLEPFAGSGATVEAALLENCHVIAIDLEKDHMPLIDARIDRFEAGLSPVKKVKPAKAQKAPQKPSGGPVTALEAAEVAMAALARKKAPQAHTALPLFEETDNA